MRDPHCGRLDDHAPHDWMGRNYSPRLPSVPRHCPGAPVIEGGNPAALDRRLAAEREMHKTGVYTADGDPFYTGPDGVPLDPAAWLDDVDTRAAARGFDPTTNGARRSDA